MVGLIAIPLWEFFKNARWGADTAMPVAYESSSFWKYPSLTEVSEQSEKGISNSLGAIGIEFIR